MAEWEDVEQRQRGRKAWLIVAAVLLAVAAVLTVRGGQVRPDGEIEIEAPLPGDSRGDSAGDSPGDSGPEPVPVVGRWQPIAPSPLAPRADHATVWTGEEMLVWGGSGLRGPHSDGAAYDPKEDVWRRIAPAPRSGGVHLTRTPGVWTGEELIVWGATEPGGGDPEAAGAAYDPQADRWRLLPPAPITPRLHHALVWDGAEVIVWGGTAAPDGVRRVLADGAAFDPRTGSWRLLAPSPLDPRAEPAATVIDERADARQPAVFVWGGVEADGQTWHRDGALYYPSSDRWELLPDMPLRRGPAPEQPSAAAVAGEVVLVAPFHDHAGDPAVVLLGTDGWRVLPDVPIGERRGARVVSAGQVALVWGGRAGGTSSVAHGAVLDPASGRWRAVAGDGIPARIGQTVVTIDADPPRQVLIWGGAGERSRPPATGAALSEF